jgi:hypothetical protein
MSRKYYETKCWEFPLSKHTSPSSWLKQFWAGLFVTPIKRVVRCTQDTRCTAGLSWDRMIMKYTQDKCCDMLLTVGRVKASRRECLLRYAGRRHPDPKVWSSVTVRKCECGSCTTVRRFSWAWQADCCSAGVSWSYASYVWGRVCGIRTLERYSERWTGRAGPFTWPSWFPNLKTIDFPFENSWRIKLTQCSPGILKISCLGFRQLWQWSSPTVKKMSCVKLWLELK